MEYLSYEQTIPLLKQTYFENFTFHKVSEIHELIDSLADEPYGTLPDSADPQSDEHRGPAGPKLTPGQLAKLKPAAKALLLADERKACGIAKFVKDNVFRDLQPVNIQDTQNCCYEAVLQQVSNIEYVFNTETGERYNHSDFRRQVVFNMTVHADKIYPKLIQWNLLPTSYKVWLHQQLSDDTPSDEVTIIGIRCLLNVS